MKKNVIVYGELSGSGVVENAVKSLTQTILDYTGEYPICVSREEDVCVPESRRFYIGTKHSNPFIEKNSDVCLSRTEEYSIKIFDDTVIIEGFDEGGVLYGCVDFYDKYLVKAELTGSSQPYTKNPFETELADFSLTDAPDIAQRGLWTWGHVVYDIRGYIDNMMKLKLNTLIVWNDFVPFNAKEIIDYAHRANIKVYFGFPWGWGVDCKKTDLSALDALSDSVVEYYENNYADLGADGIYFQSFTELSSETIGGVLIADAVTSFVNKTAARIFEKHPSLELQFGLHAMSVKNRLDYIAKTDKRIKIVWEDCGAFPYNYLPCEVEDFDSTLELTRKICSLRGEEERFGAVLKGLTKLDWNTFEHPQGAYYIGVCSDNKANERIARKKDIWRVLEAFWLSNSDYAYRTVKAIKEATHTESLVTALVEDGMFEREVHYPVALLSEMLWDCESDIRDIISSVALRSYITFAL